MMPTASQWRSRVRYIAQHIPQANRLWLALVVTVGVVDPAAATAFTVSNISDSGAGSLRQAITDANGAGAGTHTITFDGGLAGGAITLASDLPAITNNVTVDGAAASGLVISGNETNRVFFVGADDGSAVAVTIANLTVQNGQATGGNGGAAGGGGGLGAGGGLFIASGADVTVENVSFASNQAVGGSGAPGNGSGGGGGLDGAGSAGVGTDGGAGGDSGGKLGGTGGPGGVGLGGAGGDGGAGAGGGGGSGNGGGAGGNGGFSGGAGAGGSGGAGAGGSGGNGGFGGGGGAGGSNDVGLGGNGGTGGFGGGAGGSGNTASGGGGGAGMGGAVFVMNGASLTVRNSGGGGSTFTGNTVTGGLGGAGSATGGSGLGEALFLMNGTTTTFDVGAGLTTTLSQTIAGGGSEAGTSALVKEGSGTLELTGTNSYTGDTSVNAGTLRVGADDNLGAASGALTFDGGTLQYSAGFNSDRSVTLNAGGGTFDTNGNNTTLGGAISGAGALTKEGAGTLTLTGVNTYSGGTAVNAGTLQGNAASLQGNITNNATVIFDHDTAGTYASAMSGTGSLVKQNTGALTLTGVNTYTGGTTLAGGVLIVGADNNLGDAAGSLTFNGGTLQYSAGFTSGRSATLDANGGTVDTNGNIATLTGAIGGNGGLTKAGGGTLTLGGANTYSGATAINAGTLQMGAGGNLASSTAVSVSSGATFDLNNTSQTIGSIAGGGNVTLGSGTLTAGGDNSSTSVSGVISGIGGGLIKTGTGVLNLIGANVYSGPTTVSAGTLAINGSITSDTTVNSGAVLGGTGTITGQVTNNGILAPGNSIGSLSITGDYTHNAGATYRVEVDGTGASDQLVATGTATLNGGTVAVQGLGGAFGNSTTYTILTAATVSGTFNGATSNFSFLTPALSYDPSNAFLTLSRNNASYASVASTPNQRAVAQALDVAGAAPTGDMEQIINTLNGLTATEARSAYDAIGGELHATLWSTTLDVTERFSRVVNTRLGEFGAEYSLGSGLAFSGLKLAYDGDSLASLNPVSRAAAAKGLWVRLAGASGEIEGDGNARGYDNRSGGLVGGFDGKVTDRLTAGVALGYTRSDLDLEDTLDTAESKGYELAVYGRYRRKSWDYRGLVGFGDYDNETERAVTVGATQRTASGDFGVQSVFAYLEAAYRISGRGYSIEPIAAAQWSSVKNDAFTEQGAGSVNLVVSEQSADRARSYVGARFAWPILGRIRRTAEVRALWLHDFGDAAQSLDASLSGASAAIFTVETVELERDAVLLGVGILDKVVRGMRSYFDYNVELRDGDATHLLLAGVRYRW